MANSVQNAGQGPIVIIGPMGGSNAQPQGSVAPAHGSSLAPARQQEADEIRDPDGRASRPASGSLLGTLANCVWDLVCAIFSCICCCFTQRAPRRGRGRQPATHNPAPRRVGPHLTDRQKVEQVLAAPEDKVAFFTAFKALPAEIQERVRGKVDDVHYLDIQRLERGVRDDQKNSLPALPLPRFGSRIDAIDFFIKDDVFNRAARAELQKVLAEMQQNPHGNPVQPAPAAPVLPPRQMLAPNLAPAPNAAPPVRYDAYAVPFALQVDPKIYKDRAVKFLEEDFGDQNFFEKFNNLPKEVSQNIRDALGRTYQQEIAAIRGRYGFDRKLGRNDFVFKTESAAIDEFVRTGLHNTEEVMKKVVTALKGGNA